MPVYLYGIIALAAQSWRHSDLDLTTINDRRVKSNYSGNLNYYCSTRNKQCSMKYAT